MQVTDFNINEYDLASLGEHFHFEITEDYPLYRGFGEPEKHRFINSAVENAARLIARDILKREMIIIKDRQEGFTANADLVIVNLREFYKMLDIVKRAVGTTFFRYV
jgi:hypothetical protein